VRAGLYDREREAHSWAVDAECLRAAGIAAAAASRFPDPPRVRVAFIAAEEAT
jgi:hypothetical protein